MLPFRPPSTDACLWARELFPLAIGLAGLAGCAAIDPQAGPSQESCGAVPPAAANQGGSGGYGSKASSAAAAPPSGSASQICGPDAGGPCDVCESTFCCATRVACYSDPVCVCADQAIDACLGSAETGDGASTGKSAACWKAFGAMGAIEQSRVACQRLWCATACAVP